MAFFQPLVRQLTALALTAVVISPAVAQTKNADPAKAWVETFQKNHQFNGAAVVLQGGKPAVYTAGVARPDEGVMISAETPFELGQLSRVFTAVALLKLQEQGKLKLDDELAKYVPELSAYPGVTLQHLLHHTSGIPGYETLVAIHADKNVPVTNKEVVSLYKKYALPAAFRPGERVQPSSADYALLATVAERAGGADFAKLLQDLVFAPAGMQTATVGAAPKAAQPLLLRYVGGPQVLMQPNWQVVGAGGVVASANDLAAFEQALAANKLLTAANTALLFAPAKATGGATTAMGWTLLENGKLAQLEGQATGFRSVYRRSLDGKRAIIVLGNTANPKVIDLAEGLATIADGRTPAEPRISIAFTIAQTMNKAGVQAAIQQYNLLKNSDRGTYDFRESELNVLGHQLLAAGFKDQAIAIFRQNVETYPKSFNTYDSLAEGYAANGNLKDAILNYRRSLALYPDNDVARAALQKLQAQAPTE